MPRRPLWSATRAARGPARRGAGRAASGRPRPGSSAASCGPGWPSVSRAGPVLRAAARGNATRRRAGGRDDPGRLLRPQRLPGRGASASTSAPATRARSASAIRPRSAPRSASASGRSCRSTATAASSTTSASWRPRSRHGIGVVAVVFRDDAYGNVLRMQQEGFGREVASRLTNPDLVALAESFGVAGHRVDRSGPARRGGRAGPGQRAPAVIDVPIGPQPDSGACSPCGRGWPDAASASVLARRGHRARCVAVAARPLLAEVAGRPGYDYVCVDMQHGLIDLTRWRSRCCTPLARTPAVPWCGCRGTSRASSVECSTWARSA